MYEATALMKYAHLANRDTWEQARLNAYVSAQCNTTQNLKPTDIVKFPWDDDDNTSENVDIEEVNRLRDAAKNYEQFLKNKNKIETR